MKYECLYIYRPHTLELARQILDTFRDFYNLDRPNQALSCGDIPPAQAFPSLPVLPPVPDQVDPDAWLSAYHGHVYKRHVSSSGSIMVGKDHYYIGKQWRGQRIALHLDAQHQQFQVQHQGKHIKTLVIKGLHQRMMDFQEFLSTMLAEARSIEQHLRRKQSKLSRRNDALS